MNKYGMKEVFNMRFFDVKGGDELFFIDTSCKFEIKRDVKYNKNIMSVTDALLDLSVINNIMLGKYDDIEFKIYGDSTVRDSYTCIDKPVYLYVYSAKLHKFEFDVDMNISAKPRLQFEVFPQEGNELFSFVVK